ncbi:M15 family metallopeptidase [Paenibacillus sp. N1-5-1-14]|uniref:M15 family metallopeptidase n=1 Tax=Paenibacillus radicibacter TaxID=2972488 RepID=UPI002159B42D|nr:M15 family metallopeptidase [Paenibacillus radicibacter]MCR8644807.1 M15 family metallopeptidase [Paenibacillus radicibacter]
MNMKHRRLAIASGLLALSIALSGCFGGSSSGDTGTDKSVESVKPDKLKDLNVAGELIVSPGTVQSLLVEGIMTNDKKENVSQAKGINYQSSNPEVIAIDETGLMRVFDKDTNGKSVTITISLHGKIKQTFVTVKASLESTAKANGSSSVVTNAIDRMVVVNKQRALPDGYIPPDLVYPNVPFSFNDKIEKRMMRKEAATALEQLFAGAAKENIKLVGISAYRSYETQKGVFAHNVKTQGEAKAAQFSARPGQSEHQTGLAIDVSSASAKYQIEQSFINTVEGKWLAAHAHEYGFIIRFLKGKESITGYEYEPWHIRFVGIDAAKEIHAKGLTLEEYFQDAVPVQGGK